MRKLVLSWSLALAVVVLVPPATGAPNDQAAVAPDRGRRERRRAWPWRRSTPSGTEERSVFAGRNLKPGTTYGISVAGCADRESHHPARPARERLASAGRRVGTRSPSGFEPARQAGRGERRPGPRDVIGNRDARRTAKTKATCSAASRTTTAAECEETTADECNRRGRHESGAPAPAFRTPARRASRTRTFNAAYPTTTGPVCEEESAADCSAKGGVDMGAGSCEPDPCAPTSPNVVRCCIAQGDQGDQEGETVSEPPECEQPHPERLHGGNAAQRSARGRAIRIRACLHRVARFLN